MADVCGSPSYDLYSDLLVEDAESHRLETQAATAARVDESLRTEVERLRALNDSLTTRNEELTTKLAAARNLQEAVEQKFLAFRTTAHDELKKQKKEISEVKILLLKEKRTSRELRLEGRGRGGRRKVRSPILATEHSIKNCRLCILTHPPWTSHNYSIKSCRLCILSRCAY